MGGGKRGQRPVPPGGGTGSTTRTRAPRAGAARSAAAQASAQAAARKNWFNRQSGLAQTGVVLGGIALAVAGHFFLWYELIPAIGALVGRVPVVSTVTGWLFAGGAFAAWGVVAINEDTARPATVKRLKTTAWSWTAVALLCIPVGRAQTVVLPTDYWAGVFAGAYGIIATPLAIGVVALLWWLFVTKLAGRKGEPTKPQIGWICVAYATLLLVWGSTLLRT
ncbi:hypothetical protein Q5530_18985 [Saccharothrix sp. BKS2]|uniref:hypothetical protein n=1 Tax=Saccharothrix sp. BKS2 TaxID=3064400 RepID=UPI0039EC4B25